MHVVGNVCVYDMCVRYSNRPRTHPPSQSDGVLGAWRTLNITVPDFGYSSTVDIFFIYT